MQYTDCTVHNAFNALSVACVCAILSFPSWKRGKKYTSLSRISNSYALKRLLLLFLGFAFYSYWTLLPFVVFKCVLRMCASVLFVIALNYTEEKKNKTNLQHDSWLGWLFFFFQFLNTVCLQNPHRNGMMQILNGELLHSIKPSFI